MLPTPFSFLSLLSLNLSLFRTRSLLSHSRGAIRSLSGRCLRFSAIARGEPVVLHLDRIRISPSVSLSRPLLVSIGFVC